MVSIVIIEYHSLNEICKFAEISNMFTNNTDNELIVSSNSQYSASKQTKIKEEYPHIHWHFNARNGGFAYGMNEGLKVAKGDVLVIVNPDVKFKTQLEPMVCFSILRLVLLRLRLSMRMELYRIVSAVLPLLLVLLLAR